MIIVINGDEKFLMERSAKDEAVATLPDEILEFDLSTQLDEYLQESSQIPFKKTKSRTFICYNVVDIPNISNHEFDVTILVASNSKKPILTSGSSRNFSFPKLKTYEDNNEVIKWIINEGDRYELNFSRVASALFVSCGDCLRKISSEMEKVSVIVPPGMIVSMDDLKSVMCFSAEFNPKCIIDAICLGKTAKALAFYDKLQNENDETGWIIAFMQRHVLQQIKLIKLNESKFPDNKISEFLGVHPFVYKKSIRPRLGLWTLDSLSNSLNVLCEADMHHKKGIELSKFNLELEIMRLSEEANDVNKQR